MSEYSGEFSGDYGIFPEIRLESWNTRFESLIGAKPVNCPGDNAKNIFLMGFTTYNGVEQYATKTVADQFSLLGTFVGLRMTHL